MSIHEDPRITIQQATVVVGSNPVRLPTPEDGEGYRLWQRALQIKAMLPDWIRLQMKTGKTYQCVGREMHLLRAYFSVRRKYCLWMKFDPTDSWTEFCYEYYFRWLEKGKRT